MQGWLKLHRKVVGSPLFQDPFVLKLWLLCLTKATFVETSVLMDKQLVTLQPGQFVTGRNSLAEEYNRGMKPSHAVPAKTLWNWIVKFKEWGKLDINSTNKYSIISVVNWSFYQGHDGDLDNNFPTDGQQLSNKQTASGQQVDSKFPTDGQQMDTNKNVKNEKNAEKGEKLGAVCSESIKLLNELLGTSYKPTSKATQEKIRARLNEGFTSDDILAVIRKKHAEWHGDSKMANYLRPETLFGTKFESYLNQVNASSGSGDGSGGRSLEEEFDD
ncbi:conserved phage C-terminal domain-containing protein [Tumebacillus permanentifrigoris]|uniref:Putative phage protein (TIGR02220 family) n=1 Tax=Tumebacillus permanentifrigoris TaxID=378543 RepID=A0A316D2U9_9BACL|nr:conserved phage C-terminal domain-containing protein [Tumebacillus permanentifrigoris]PWK05277.1 putative phage protein (TIGR02220 family) [Tumebacillus permanentifrigoris]